MNVSQETLNPILHDWRSRKLIELVLKLQSGGTPKTDDPSFYGGDIPFVAIEDVTSSNKFLRSTAKAITSAGLNNSSAWLVPPQSILYSIYATLGVPIINEVAVATNQAILNIIPDDRLIDMEYLYYWLASIKPYIGKFSAQTTQSNLSAKIVSEFEIAYPPLPVQKRIAAVLSCIDCAIEQTEAHITKQQRIESGLTQDLLTKGIDEHGNIRSEATHEFKDSALGRIPKKWEVSGLEKKRGIDRPYLRTGPFGSSLKGKDWVEEGVPVVTIGSLGEGYFIHSELLHITESKASTLQSYVLEVGDVVFSRVADVGRSVVVTEAEQGWIMSSNLMRISLDKKQAIPAYIYLSIAYNHSTRNQIRRLINAGGRDVANSEVMNALEFAWPESDEQERIIMALNKFDDSYRREQGYLLKLRSLKTGLMQDLLTGKVSVESLLTEQTVAVG